MLVIKTTVLKNGRFGSVEEFLADVS